MKKIIAGVAAFGVMAVGFGAYAEGWMPSGDTHNSATITVSNSAKITTDASSKANTGNNDADAKSFALGGSSRAKGGMIDTGDATATTEVIVAANSNDLAIDQSGCGCERDGDVWNSADVGLSNRANITTRARSKANTGDNDADAKAGSLGGSSRAKGGVILTGDADAWTTVGVVANVNMVRVMQ